MHTAYVYSTSRLNTLSYSLLSATDIERLLVAAPGNDLNEALKETYIAPYLAHAEGDMPMALEDTLIEAKKLIHRIAPYGDMFRVLWLQYDIHNLRVFAKAAAKGLSYATCEPHLSRRGIYEPTYLYEHVQARTLNRLQSEWQASYDEAARLAAAGELDRVDAILDQTFFAMALRVARRSNDTFIMKYLRAVIDLYNVKSRLRALAHGELSAPTFVSGGSFNAGELETKDQVFTVLRSLGGEAQWNAAIEYLEATGNTTRLDARADEYLINLAKTASTDMFSSASLVLYYLLCRQAAANVRTIFVGKNSGMDVTDIRANLRRAHVNQ